MTTLNHQQQAQVVAIQRAAATLATVDLAARCAALGLPQESGADALVGMGELARRPSRSPEEGVGTTIRATAQVITLRAFAQDLQLTPPDFAASQPNGKPVRLTDHLLAVHYLLCDLPLAPTGQLITFRDLPGGQFYFAPFTSRTTKPLVDRIANNLDLLRHNLNRFDHTFNPTGGTPALCNAGVPPAVEHIATPPISTGNAAPTASQSLTTRIHALGRLAITLIYHPGDEEGPPTAEVLFDACIKRVYGAEDAAALAGRICLGLL